MRERFGGREIGGQPWSRDVGRSGFVAVVSDRIEQPDRVELGPVAKAGLQREPRLEAEDSSIHAVGAQQGRGVLGPSLARPQSRGPSGTTSSDPRVITAWLSAARRCRSTPSDLDEQRPSRRPFAASSVSSARLGSEDFRGRGAGERRAAQDKARGGPRERRRIAPQNQRQRRRRAGRSRQLDGIEVDRPVVLSARITAWRSSS